MNLSYIHYSKYPPFHNFIRSELRIFFNLFAVDCELFNGFYFICHYHNIAGEAAVEHKHFFA